LLPVSIRHGKQREAAESVMFKEVCALRQLGRSAKYQHKTAGGRSYRRCSIHHSEAGRIDRRDLRQVFNSLQRHPHRRRIGSKENFEAAANGAGKGISFQAIERARVVLPVVRLRYRGQLQRGVGLHFAADWAASTQCQQRIAYASRRSQRTATQEQTSGKSQITPPRTAKAAGPMKRLCFPFWEMQTLGEPSRYSRVIQGLRTKVFRIVLAPRSKLQTDFSFRHKL